MPPLGDHLAEAIRNIELRHQDNFSIHGGRGPHQLSSTAKKRRSRRGTPLKIKKQKLNYNLQKLNNKDELGSQRSVSSVGEQPDPQQ